MTTEKTPGQLAYEQAVTEFYFECQPKGVWEWLSPQSQRAWERTIAKVSAPLIERIVVLEAEVKHWKEIARLRLRSGKVGK